MLEYGICAPLAAAAATGAPVTADLSDTFGLRLTPELSFAAFVPVIAAAIGFGAYIYRTVGVFEDQMKTLLRTMERLENEVGGEAETRRNDMKAQAIDFREDIGKQTNTLRADMEKQNVSLRADMEKQNVSLRADMERQNVSLRADMEKQNSSLRDDLRALDEKFDRKFDAISQDVAYLRGVRTEQERQARITILEP